MTSLSDPPRTRMEIKDLTLNSHAGSVVRSAVGRKWIQKQGDQLKDLHFGPRTAAN